MAVDENGNVTAKINELAKYQDNIIENPLFVVGNPDPSGEAYSANVEDVKSLLASSDIKGLPLPDGINDLNDIQESGVYILNQTVFTNGGYENSHYIAGVMLTSDIILIVENYSTGDVIQHLIWPFEGGESVRRKVLNNASWAHGSEWTKWEHWGGVYWIDGAHGGAFELAGGMNILKTQGTYIVNVPVSNNAQMSAKHLPPKQIPPQTQYQGAIYVEVTGRNNYEGTEQWLIQRAHLVRDNSITVDGGDLSIGATDRGAVWERRFNMRNAVGGINHNYWGDWMLQTNTLAGASFNGFTAADKTLAAGTATVPTLVLAKGVNEQTTPVKGSLNYDGTGLYIILDDGLKYQISLTPVAP